MASSYITQAEVMNEVDMSDVIDREIARIEALLNTEDDDKLLAMIERVQARLQWLEDELRADGELC